MTEKRDRGTCEAKGCGLEKGHKGRHWAYWMGDPRKPCHEKGCIYGVGHELPHLTAEEAKQGGQ